MKKMIYLLLCLLSGILPVFAQTATVTGHVISADDGEPVIGASVTVKGTTVGAVTDFDGNFTLKVPENARVITVSYLGMLPQEAPIRPEMLVRLRPDTKSLGEIVVTALGISKEKKALGYAVQDVKADELTRAANTSLSGAIQGKVSGIEIASSSGMPGASAKITIRGSRSFTGDNTPLYVVDGMPIASSSDVSTENSVTGTDFANRAVDLDPNDIESINILKGQAASALYGMRASNGVVVITTKSGKAAGKGKPEVSIASNLSFDVISTLPAFQAEYAQGNNGAYSPTASTSWGPKIAELPNDPVYGGNTANAYTAAGRHEGKYYVPQRAAAGLDPWAAPQAYRNARDFFRTGSTWSNAVNIMQGFDKGNYSFTLGNMTSEGIVPSTGMDRYNAKLAAEARLHPNWTTGFSGNFVASAISKQSSANNGVTATVFPAPPSYDLAGIPSHIAGDPYTQNTYRGTGGFDAAYWAVENNRFTERSQRFFGNAYVNYTTRFHSERHTLNLKYQLGNDAYTTNYSDVWGYGHANGLGEISEYNYTINELNSLFTATWNWAVSEELALDALYGNELVENKRQYHKAQGFNFNFPGWNHLENASLFTGYAKYRRNRTAGNFGSLSLVYRNMLYLNVTGRHDIVSSMPRNNRSFFYPSVSAGWIFTELEALKSRVLTYGKLRLSYAEVGQAGDYYATYYRTPAYGGGFSSGTPVLYPIDGIVAYTQYGTVYDPNLRPQNTKSYETGVDLSFLNGLVSLNYTYSRQNVKDQIFPVPLAGSTGSEELITNGGSVHTDAHEVTLGFSPVNTANIKWDFAFNFTRIDNYVDELAPGVKSIFLGGFVEPQVRAGIGYKYPVIYGVSYLRNEAGQIVVDEKGLPQAGPEQVIGTVSPDFRLGFNTTLEAFKFRLSALVDWKQGGQMYGATVGLLDYYGVTQKTADARKGKFLFEKEAVKVTGTDAGRNPMYAPNDIQIDGTQAGAAYAYFNRLNEISESMIYDNSFVKLREITLSYPVWDRQSLKVSLTAFARNILLWTNLEGIDPEATQGNNNMSGAFERFSLPGSSSYGVGVNVKF
jgi:TonB-linked SusC/RagA family outer membrane protein